MLLKFALNGKWTAIFLFNFFKYDVKTEVRGHVMREVCMLRQDLCMHFRGVVMSLSLSLHTHRDLRCFFAH